MSEQPEIVAQVRGWVEEAEHDLSNYEMSRHLTSLSQPRVL